MKDNNISNNCLIDTLKNQYYSDCIEVQFLSYDKGWLFFKNKDRLNFRIIRDFEDNKIYIKILKDVFNHNTYCLLEKINKFYEIKH